MRGLSSTLGGISLLCAALWLFVHGYPSTPVLGLLGGALVLLYRGYQGLTIGESVDDAMLPAQFIANPRRAALDLAVDRIGQLFEDGQPTHDAAEGEERKFDPDAIIAHYLEKRSDAAPAPAAPPAARGFGRKGL